ncbi:hypothetical protein JCM19239_6507 [Vibrio variabilis]|nr:hypothetical protein JCM19239_6507 [Vibrio variabilis]
MKDFFKTNIRRIRYLTNVLSIALVVLSIAAVAMRGLNFG